MVSATGAVTRPGALADPADVDPHRDPHPRQRHRDEDLRRHGAARRRTTRPRRTPPRPPSTIVHADDVRGYLTLPGGGQHGATVAWSSSDPATVAPDGVVTRPAHGAGDATVTLTATVTVGSATATRAFALTVREKPEAAPYKGYAFSYFTGNSIAGEKIYFAASRGNHALQLGRAQRRPARCSSPRWARWACATRS